MSERITKIVNELAGIVVEKGKNLRIAFNEDETSTKHQPEAFHFLKLNEKRLGADFEVYGFVGKMEGEPKALTHVLAEVVLPIQTSEPEAYKAAINYLRGQGEVMGDMQNDWNNLLDRLSPDNQ